MEREPSDASRPKRTLARIATGVVVLVLLAAFALLLYQYYLTYDAAQPPRSDMPGLALVALAISVVATVTYAVFLFVGLRAIRRLRSYYLPDGDHGDRVREEGDGGRDSTLRERCGRDGLLFAQMAVLAVGVVSLAVSVLYALAGSLTDLVVTTLPLWIYGVAGLYLSFGFIPSLRERHQLPSEGILKEAGVEILDRDLRSRIGAKVFIAFLVPGLLMYLVKLYLSATRSGDVGVLSISVPAAFLILIVVTWRRSEL